MRKRITRSSTDRMLAGVCGGLGEYFGIDSTWIRLAFIFLTPLTYFLTIVVYVVCVFSFPEKRNIQETDFKKRRRRPKASKKYY
ncbi:PspC domain-containing protein [Companilactobacillus musae]|jgi:Putative stress-responsive transcriptional regulator|uniref:PspC domain-containing protein n=1 Tax=Companilactobacillus musae TaxID=1903258 RepID=UPI000E656293|nr:PspC domain-containing protein [Companilactobacillus musae]